MKKIPRYLFGPKLSEKLKSESCLRFFIGRVMISFSFKKAIVYQTMNLVGTMNGEDKLCFLMDPTLVGVWLFFLNLRFLVTVLSLFLIQVVDMSFLI